MISIILLPFLIAFVSFLTPTGPITILIFKNTLLGKYGRAIMITVGAALGQLFYGDFALFLINQILSESLKHASQILSTIVFLILGIHLLISKPKKSYDIIPLRDLGLLEKFRYFFVGLFVTLVNLSLLFSWLAVITFFVSFNLLIVTGVSDMILFSLSMIGGVFLGSFAMMAIVRNYKKNISDKFLDKMLSFLGVILIIIALVFLFSVFVS